jgi:4a-hydroxytetrahydrobiopterin dehydratase
MSGILLDDMTLSAELAKLDRWALITPEATPVLTTERRFDDFAAAMAFVDRVAEIAEDLNHHPDITISYDRVGLQISSHEQGGVTDLCVTLAERVDALD